MDEKKEYSVLDDSFDGLDEKLIKGIVQELEEKSYEEVLAIAKKDGIDNAESFTKEELIEKINDLLNEDE